VKRLLVAVTLVALSACGDGNSPTLPTDGSLGLTIQDLVVGTGPVALAGDTITVNYVGTLTNGTQFDSSYDSGIPFVFRLATGQVIVGWDQGLQGMRVGGKRHLVIPSRFGYGNVAQPSIPANSTLVFDVDLVSIAGR
jgi:peptidylprolyl isomerase